MTNLQAHGGTLAHSRDQLLGGPCSYISRSKDSRDGFLHHAIGGDKASLIEVNQPIKPAPIGVKSNKNKNGSREMLISFGIGSRDRE